MMIWVLVADQNRASIYSFRTPRHDWEVVMSLGQAPRRDAADAPHRVDQTFVERLVQKLDEGMRSRRYRRLVLVAPRRLLEILHRALPLSVARRVALTLPENLYGLDARSLQAGVDAYLSTCGSGGSIA